MPRAEFAGGGVVSRSLSSPRVLTDSPPTAAEGPRRGPGSGAQETVGTPDSAAGAGAVTGVGRRRAHSLCSSGHERPSQVPRPGPPPGPLGPPPLSLRPTHQLPLPAGGGGSGPEAAAAAAARGPGWGHGCEPEPERTSAAGGVPARGHREVPDRLVGTEAGWDWAGPGGGAKGRVPRGHGRTGTHLRAPHLRRAPGGAVRTLTPLAPPRVRPPGRSIPRSAPLWWTLCLAALGGFARFCFPARDLAVSPRKRKPRPACCVPGRASERPAGRLAAGTPPLPRRRQTRRFSVPVVFRTSLHPREPLSVREPGGDECFTARATVVCPPPRASSARWPWLGPLRRMMGLQGPGGRVRVLWHDPSSPAQGQLAVLQLLVAVGGNALSLSGWLEPFSLTGFEHSRV